MRIIWLTMALLTVAGTAVAEERNTQGVTFPKWGVRVNLPADKVSVRQEGSLFVGDLGPAGSIPGHFIFRILPHPDHAGKPAAELLDEKRRQVDVRQGRKVGKVTETVFLGAPAAYYESEKLAPFHQYFHNVAVVSGECLITLTTESATDNPGLAAEYFRSVIAKIERLDPYGPVAPACKPKTREQE